MFERIWWLLVLVSIQFQNGNSIKCYSCTTSLDEECREPYDSLMQPVKCDSGALAETRTFAEPLGERFARLYDVQLLEAAVPLNCVKQVTKVRGEEVIFRGCQLPRDYSLDVCKKVLDEPHNKDGIDVKHCSLCDMDGCNGAVRMRGNVAAGSLAAALATLWTTRAHSVL